MRNIISFPLLALAVILQSAAVSQVTLLSGYADLPMLILIAWALQERVRSAWHWTLLSCILLGFVSRMPWFVFVLGYFTVVFIAQIFRRRVWQAPLLAMFSVTFIGTMFIHILSFSILRILGTPFVFADVIGLITLPSLLLNMLFSIPVYTFMRDLARWVYPEEEYE